MVRIVLKVVIRRVRMVARTVRIDRMVTKPALLTKMGVPAPFTVETIIDIQVPRNKTPPNTNGCSGSLGGNTALALICWLYMESPTSC